MSDIGVTQSINNVLVSTSPIDVVVTHARYDVTVAPVRYISVDEGVDAPLLDFSVSDNSQYIALSFP